MVEHHRTIGPVSLHCLTKFQAMQMIAAAVKSRHPLQIAICNAHTFMRAVDEPAYADTLNKMTVLNDGAGLNIASRALYSEPFPENLNGTDFVPYLMAEIDHPLRVFLLGAAPDKVAKAAAVIQEKYPQHLVVGARDGYFDPADRDAVCREVADAKPDLLLVAMGNPKQEEFIVENRERLGATVAIGVGALFDFMSGSVVRAPKVVRAVGLEWVFRLMQEPRRLFGRYVVGIPRFLLYIRGLKKAARA
ncbi:MAG: WecB/TagA/CpsF family glycosyltransferase [Rhodobacteraceae bacterium]|nr:WecB/TagA/CpsF family glycosyltransferase [Paracoccaceae bacterium]